MAVMVMVSVVSGFYTKNNFVRQWHREKIWLPRAISRVAKFLKIEIGTFDHAH